MEDHEEVLIPSLCQESDIVTENLGGGGNIGAREKVGN